MSRINLFTLMLCFGIISFFLAAEKTYALLPDADCAAGGCTVRYDSAEDICNFETKTEVQVANDPSFNYPYGLFEFSLGSCLPALSPQSAEKVKTKELLSSSMVLYFFDSEHNPINMEGYTYRKYGLEPVDNPSTSINETTELHWYDFMYDGTTGAQISGNTITLHFVDGQRGDDDISLNGRIIDQGGPGDGLTIPTLNEWGVIIFLVLAGLVSVYSMRRQMKLKN